MSQTSFNSPFSKESSRLPEVQSVVVFPDLIAEGHRGNKLCDAILESVRTSQFVNFVMICFPAISQTIKKIFTQAGIETTHGSLFVHRNTPVAPTCALAIWGMEEGKEVVSECVRTQKILNTALS